MPSEALGGGKSDNTSCGMRMFAVVSFFVHLLFEYACPELVRHARCGARPLREVVRDLPYPVEASVENSEYNREGDPENPFPCLLSLFYILLPNLIFLPD